MPTHAWRNWARDQRCEPAALHEPARTADVVAVVERAAEAGRVVRAAGAGHSFTDAVLTDGDLLSLRRMGRVLDVDRRSGLVRVQAGATLGALSEALWDHGLAFENLGDIDVQSIAGATATGTHGTGAGLQNLSASLAAVQLVAGDGTVHELDEAGDPDGWRAARVSVGALGVVTEVTLRTVPAYVLRGVDEGRPLGEVLDALGELPDRTRHFELFAFPHTDIALTRTNEIVDLAPSPPSRGRRVLHDDVLTNGAFGALCRIGRARPALVPRLNRVAARAAAGRVERVDRAHRIFASPRRVRFTEMEYAVPRERAAEVVRAVLEITSSPAWDVPFPIEVRFVAGDDALLSPAGGRATCYVAVHMYRGMPFEGCFRAVEALMDEVGGRPHWGKRHFQTAATLAPRYPGWGTFREVRRRLDPEGRFANAYVRRVLGAP